MDSMPYSSATPVFAPPFVDRWRLYDLRHRHSRDVPPDSADVAAPAAPVALAAAA